MRLSETSSTVTGCVTPSSVKTRVMPTLRPTNPIDILKALLDLDLYIDSGRQIELHERVHGLVRRVDDVHQPQMRADLQLVARRLVDVRRAQQVEALLARRQRHGTAHHR